VEKATPKINPAYFTGSPHSIFKAYQSMAYHPAARAGTAGAHKPIKCLWPCMPVALG
jgi:hypothetical protein